MKNNDFSEKLVIAAGENLKEREYWLNKLSGNLVKTVFPTDHNPDSTRAGQPVKDKMIHRFSGELVSKLTMFCDGSDVRLHLLIITGLILLVHRYTGDNDITIATPIYKQDTDAEFVNSVLALRNRVQDNMLFKELLLQVKQTLREACENYSYPVEILAKELNIPGTGQDDFPLFDMALLVETIHEKKYLQRVNLNMVFSFKRTGGSLAGEVEYNTLLYEKTTIARILSNLEHLLSQVLINIDIRVSAVDAFSEEEKKRLLYEFNPPPVDLPESKTIPQLFAGQVERTPDHIALMAKAQGGGKRYIHITYRQLNEDSNRLATLLRKKRVGPNSLIAVLLERSLEMIISLIGILKAGGAYLPIEPDIPIKRVISILEDSYAPVLLTGSDIIDTYTFTALQTVTANPAPIYVTARRPQILDFDNMPVPDRSLVDYEKYNRYIGQANMKNTVTLQCTRGCPYECLYCHKIWPKKHVIRSAEHVFSEIRLFYNMGVRRFTLIDDIFNLDKKNSAKFFQLIIKHKLDLQLSFPNGMRGDLLSKAYIDLMVDAGVKEIALALETASPRIQELIKKRLNLDTFRENLEYLCEKYPQVANRLYTMVGFPTETKAEAMMTLDFIKSLKWLHLPYIFILKIYPNTEMEKLAINKGIPQEAITRSLGLPYHELPETLPFEKAFVLKYQTDFFNNYFLAKERLVTLLPHQFRIYTEDEMLQAYNGYLPYKVHSLKELLDFFGITPQELGRETCRPPDYMEIPGFNKKLEHYFKPQKPAPKAFRVLLLDLSMVFANQEDRFANSNEPPLGLLYLLTYLYQQQGSSIHGKIAKTRIDFHNYRELKELIQEFKPDLLGIRTLSMYREFFHKTAALIRQWGIDIPIITGGPYATSSYKSILQDKNIDLAVLGEGEITFNQLILKIKEKGGKLPGTEVLKEIPGIAFNPANSRTMPTPNRQLIMLDTIKTQLSQQPHHDLPPVNQPADLAYIIYTSGTTGKPNGVMIEHRNLVSLMFNNRNLYHFNSSDVWTMCHSYGFDFSVWEMYGALLFGGKLIVIPKLEAIDPVKFPGLLEKEKVTVLNQTPSAFFNITARLNPEKINLKIRYLIFGGEALTPHRLKLWAQAYPQVKLINMYGITETTVHVTYKEIGPGEISRDKSNIGKPLASLTTYIMDKNLRLKPLGAAGEICVGGQGVGRGYLNTPQLTAGRFRQNPYKPGERLYQSGDLARISPQGEIEYLGRIDHQVKIRGFRIELDEIRRLLARHPSIKEAIAVVREDEEKNKDLAAYYVETTPVSVRQLRDYLSNYLPGYMIPAHFLSIDKIPLTVNGKLDRETLFKKGKSPGSQVEITPPQHRLEQQIAAAWQQVLKVNIEEIGIYNSFFELGGDSIKIIQVAGKLKDVLDRDIPITTLFEYPTIHSLSEFLTQEKLAQNNDSPGKAEEITRSRKIADARTRQDQRRNRRKN